MNKTTINLLGDEIISCIKDLLETKHLYQSVYINGDIVQKLIDEAESSPAAELEKACLKAASVLPGKHSFSPKSVFEQFLTRYKKEISDTKDFILGTFWTFSTDACSQPSIEKSEIFNEVTHFMLPTISVPCTQCKAVKPAHNSGFREQKYDWPPISWKITRNNHEVPCQTFTFPYHCQACKKEPLVFLVHRVGSKLTLAGRNHFEDIHVPNFIPKDESKFYKDAMVAFNTGNILCGLFQLRTTIEQYMRRVTGIKNKISGEDLADDYSTLLDEEFPRKFPSLKTVYSELSKCIHAADNNAEQFQKSKGDMERHFELLKHFPITDGN